MSYGKGDMIFGTYQDAPMKAVLVAFPESLAAAFHVCVKYRIVF